MVMKYKDYHHLMINYVDIIHGQTFVVIEGFVVVIVEIVVVFVVIEDFVVVFVVVVSYLN